MKKLFRIISLALAAALTAGTASVFAACGKKANDDIIIDADGNIRPGGDGSAAKVQFWGWGGEEETAVFKQIVNSFNKKYEGVIEVKYTQRPADGYGESLITTLLGSGGPDVFYVEDKFFKQYATLGYLTDLTEFAKDSKVLVESEMFPNTMSRYRYNVTTTTSDAGDPLLAVPKDLAPTGIFYNATYFKQAGVEIISMSEEEVKEAIIRGDKTPGGKELTVRGYDPVGRVFNNKIAMSWEDCVSLSNLVMQRTQADYGYFSEWWFNYGWSVGGDCVEYLETDDASFNGGYYKFTLNDSGKNYIVKDEYSGTVTVNGNEYSAGEIISYNDKTALTSAQKANCNELPSQREAFTEFVRLSQPSGQLVDNVAGVYADTGSFYGAEANGDLKGYGIAPSPTNIKSDGKVGYFTSGKVAMLFNTMSSVRQISENLSDDWDVAPPLVYKEYSDDGKEVLVHGIQAAHSGSVGIALNRKSSVKQAAYLFAEYISSAEGQSIQAQEGFAIPLQKDVAASDVYLNSSWGKGKNFGIFIDAAEYETPGDWWYLSSKEWIDDWSSLLNGDVRNGKITLTAFYNSDAFKGTQAKLNNYTLKK